MTTTNFDNTIKTLKNTAISKRKSLGKFKKFIPVTNCQLDLYGSRININVITEETLKYILIILNSYRLSVIDLEIGDDVKISGYTINEWITDVKNRLQYLHNNDTLKQINEVEKTLDGLLSSECKLELKLQDITDLLSNI